MRVLVIFDGRLFGSVDCVVRENYVAGEILCVFVMILAAWVLGF